MKLIEIVALFLTITGELILMIGNPEFVKIAYLFFLTGNIFWINIGLRCKFKSIALLNIIFFIVGLIGLSNWS